MFVHLLNLNACARVTLVTEVLPTQGHTNATACLFCSSTALVPRNCICCNKRYDEDASPAHSLGHTDACFLRTMRVSVC